MARASLTIEPLVVHAEGPLHVGSGFGAGLVDRAVVRDRWRQPYLPGSSLKGRVREACERIALTHGLRVCRPPYPGGMCRPGSPEGPCLVCRVFGAPGGRSDETQGLHWDNAYLDPEWKTASGSLPLTYARTQVGISRARGVAREGLLFTDEFAAEGLFFATRVAGFLDLAPMMGQDDQYYEVTLLVAGLRSVDRLGGATSRGAGRCTLELPQAVTVEPVAGGRLELPVAGVLDHLEWIELFPE